MNLVGEILNDTWILLKRIGRGSFSEIYLGLNIHTSVPSQENLFVAIKVQKLSSSSNEGFSISSSVLRWEADVLKMLKNSNDEFITKIAFPKFFHYDSHICSSLLQTSSNQNDKFKYEYIAMEYLSGEDMSRLRDVTRSNLGFIPIHVVFYLTFQILECIKNLHLKGLVHRYVIRFKLFDNKA